MRYVKIPLVLLLVMTMTSWSTAIATYSAPAQSTALERGYRTGYSDGYSAGSRDTSDNAPRDYQNKEEYQRADRNYNQVWGPAEDYRDGYQQGFEAGYTAGYDRATFDSTIPTGLKARGTPNSGPAGTPAANQDQNTNQNVPQNNPDNSSQSGNVPASGPISLPPDAILLIELQSSLSTDASQRGDRFQARVIDPREFEGAIVDGRVTNVKRAGKVKGTAQIQLSFESIRLPDGRTTGLNADVIEVVDTGRDDAGKVDSEGGVKGRDSTKDDVTKVGAGAGVGAIIGAIIGGGKGAAIGAVLGGGVGAGTVLSQRGHEVRLARGQQLRIRTATETKVQ
jgi:hypothetical protein